VSNLRAKLLLLNGKNGRLQCQVITLTCNIVCSHLSIVPSAITPSLDRIESKWLTCFTDGSIFRGLKVKNAQDQGMIACIIYTDPAQDGNITAENGYAEYPDGPGRNPSQVQRGSVQFLSSKSLLGHLLGCSSTCWRSPVTCPLDQ
jgi:hypothetical protein